MRASLEPSRLIASAIVIALSIAAPAFGAERSVTEEVLEILQHSGVISEATYDELSARARAEAAALAATPAEAPPELPPRAPEDPKGWNVRWNNGTKIERNDGRFKLKFGGRMMLDFAQVWGDSDLRQTVGNGDFGNGVEFRRARLFAEGTLYDRLTFKIQYEFANTGQDGDNVDFKDVYVGLEGLGPVGTLRVGQMKEDFSLEEMTSSKYIVFMERGLPSVFNPGRNTGVSAYNSFLDGRLRYALGGFHATDRGGFGWKDSDGTTYHITGRVTGLPYWEEGGKRLVHLGFDYSHQFTGSGGTGLRYHRRPEAHLAGPYVDTQIPAPVGGTATGIAANGVDLFTVEFAANYDSLSLQAEWQASLLDRPGQKDALLWGLYGQVAYFLTGEHRNYSRKYANFGRTKLLSTFDPEKGDWGALELAARVSYLDLNDRGIRGGRLLDFTAGANWYLWPNLRLMANYVHSKLRNRGTASPGAGSGNLYEMRLQFDF